MFVDRILQTIQVAIMATIIPGTVYYVENYSPYTKDKRYIETRINSNEKAIDKLTVIVDRVTRDKE